MIPVISRKSNSTKSNPELSRYLYGLGGNPPIFNGEITDSRKVIPCNKTAPFPLVMVGDMIFYDGSGKGMANECVFAQGLAVLLYIEDKNGWAK